MKKLILIAIIIFPGIIYFFLMGGSGAEKALDNFSEAWAANRMTEAYQYSVQSELEPTMQKKGVNDLTRWMMGSVMGVNTKIVSSSPAPGGEGELIKGSILILFNPQGVQSAMRATMYARVKFESRVVKKADGWKVVSFEPVLDEMGELKENEQI